MDIRFGAMAPSLVEQLADTLTGYERPHYQRRWLDRHGWPYETDANHRPKVSRSYAEPACPRRRHRRLYTALGLPKNLPATP